MTLAVLALQKCSRMVLFADTMAVTVTLPSVPGHFTCEVTESDAWRSPLTVKVWSEHVFAVTTVGVMFPVLNARMLLIVAPGGEQVGQRTSLSREVVPTRCLLTLEEVV